MSNIIITHGTPYLDCIYIAFKRIWCFANIFLWRTRGSIFLFYFGNKTTGNFCILYKLTACQFKMIIGWTYLKMFPRLCGPYNKSNSQHLFHVRYKENNVLTYININVSAFKFQDLYINFATLDFGNGRTCTVSSRSGNRGRLQRCALRQLA